MLFMLALMFMPQKVVKTYPKPSKDCFYQWISNPSKLENKCEESMVVSVAYKNGKGTYRILKHGEVLSLLDQPLKVFACTLGQGEPSASLEKRVHPGYKTDQYVCLTEELSFSYINPVTGGK